MCLGARSLTTRSRRKRNARIRQMSTWFRRGDFFMNPRPALSKCSVRRLMGPIPKSTLRYDEMRQALESPVLTEADWVCRKIVRRISEGYALQRLYRRLCGETPERRVQWGHANFEPPVSD